MQRMYYKIEKEQRSQEPIKGSIISSDGNGSKMNIIFLYIRAVYKSLKKSRKKRWKNIGGNTANHNRQSM